MKVLQTKVGKLLLVISLLAGISAYPVVTQAQTAPEDPEFDPLISLQRFQQNYSNQEIMPENNANTGAATFSIPIKVPPGRGGVQPELSLSYNSSSKNGWIGVGWSLDLGSIQRMTKHGINYAGTDFLYNGAIELVSRPSWGSGYYGTRIEEAFSKFYMDSSSGGWIVTAKDGTRYYYGSTSASRQNDPADGLRVFKWCLDRIEDTNGNGMTVTYIKDQGQIYPQRIDYTDAKNYVLFYLEDRDPLKVEDIPISYAPNFEVITSKRLYRIEVYGNNTLATTYNLQYDISALSGRSLLARVSQNNLPPTYFTYLPGGSGGCNPAPSQVTTTNVNSGEWKYIYFADINGDALPDLVKQYLGGYYYTYLSLGDGSFGPASTSQVFGLGSASQYIDLVDVNGDGKRDLVRHHSGTFSVHWSLGDGTFETNGIETNTSVMSGEADDVHFADVDGDGLSDLIKHNLYCYKIYHSDGTGNFNVTADSDVDSEAEVYRSCPEPMSSESAYIYFADVNGDGRADLIKHNLHGIFNVHLSTGNKFNEMPVTTQTTTLSGEYNDVHLIDLNGDGLSDLVKRSLYGVTLTYLSLGDGSFAKEKQFDLAINNENRLIHFADLNGDGISDLVKHSNDGTYYNYTSRGDGSFDTQPVPFIPNFITDESPHVHFVDVNGDGMEDLIKYGQITGDVNTFLAVGTPSDLLYAIGYAKDNVEDPEPELAVVVHHTYKSSASAQNLLLPFTLQVLSEAKLTLYSPTEDDTNQIVSVTSYDYSGGFYDAEDREFRGFGKTEQTNPDETTVVRSFHTTDAFLKGRHEWLELQDRTDPDNPSLMIRADFTWDKLFFPSPDNESAFLKLLQRRTEFYDDQTVYIQTDLSYDDTNGNLLSSTSSGSGAESVTTSYAYANLDSWLWRKTRETIEGSNSGKVRETFFEYYDDGTGNLLAQESWLDSGDNPRITMTYDSYGNPASVTDARGNITTTDYETTLSTFPSRVESPSTGGVNHITEYLDYDYRWGKVKSVEDENGQVTDYSYDDVGRLVSVFYPDGGRRYLNYYDNVLPRRALIQVKDKTGYINTEYYYDGLLRKIFTRSTSISSKWVRTEWYYDEMGRNYFAQGPYFEGSFDPIPYERTIFDLRGRPTQVLRPVPEHGEVATQYAYSGFNTTVTDPDGASKTEVKDYLGRIYRVLEHTDLEDHQTDYEYNAAGDLLSVVNDFGHTTLIGYDTLGRKVSMSDPDMGYWTYAYDDNSNLISQTDAKLQQISFSYDELNRVTSKSYSTSDPSINYTYDQAILGKGKLYSVAVSDGQVIDYLDEYDSMGRVLQETRSINGAPQSYTNGYTYDVAGQLYQVTYPDGYIVYYSYIPGTSLLSYVRSSNNIYHARITDYTPDGKPKTILYGSDYILSGYSARDQYTYDSQSGRMLRVNSYSLKNTQSFQDLQYRYSPAGDVIEIYDQLGAVTYSYSYDKLHRLVEEVATGFAPAVDNVTLDYTYDEAFQPHAVQQIGLNGAVPENFLYDDNGNLYNGPDFTDPAQVAFRTIEYNAENMPTGIVHSALGSTEFVYDGNGKRAVKVSPNGTTYYVNDYYEVENGTGTNYVFAGNKRIAKVTGNTIYYYHKDHLGSTRAVSDYGTGNSIEKANYLPFGFKRANSGNNVTRYRFTDQELDGSTGLYNYNARLYDPVIGRFVSADTMVPDWLDPQALDRYTYVRNNPLKYIDPSGNFWYKIADWLDTKFFNEAEAFWDQYAVNNTNISTQIIGTAGKTLTTFGKQTYDVLRFGTGFAEGGAENIAADIGRGSGIILVVTGAGSKYTPKRVPKAIPKFASKKTPLWSSTKNKTSVENAFGHWKKHGSEFPELQNAKQYAEQAKDFLNNPPKGTLTKTRPNGDVLRYDPKTNTFGVQNADGAPKTMFRPSDGINYWNKQ